MSTLQAAIKQSISKEYADQLTYKILSILHRKAQEGDATAKAIISEAMKRE